MRLSEDQLRSLMIAGLDGDARAHADLLGALVLPLRAFYRRRMQGGENDIEDLVQETLIAIHTRRASYDRDRPFTAWLFAIARYKMIDHFRRARIECPIETAEALLLGEGFEEASNARMDVDRLLGGLPIKQSDAIRRTKLDGLSVAEAASAADIGESDVKISVHRGLKSLARRLFGGLE